MAQPLFQGVFFFDASFWPVDIPVFYGTVEYNPFVSLRKITRSQLHALANDRIALGAYLSLWKDCIDYGQGIGDLRVGESAAFGDVLLASGDKELRATVGLLLTPRPGTKASETSRLAIEILLKAFLAKRGHLDDDEARRLGHDLDAIVQRCREVAGIDPMASQQSDLSSLPPIASRYSTGPVNLADLWQHYRLAQGLGAWVTRQLSGRDIDIPMH
jgi:hypothetical protein